MGVELHVVLLYTYPDDVPTKEEVEDTLSPDAVLTYEEEEV